MEKHTLLARNLTKSFDVEGGRIEVLRNVSVTLQSGETAALFGPSGSGKSTLLNVLSLLDRPDAGTIEFDGQQVDVGCAESVQALRAAHIGIVFQGFNLIPTLSALENVEMALLPVLREKRERRTRATATLDRVGLGNRLHHRPNQLSGGQQQRVGIARALCKQPAFVLADEPTANLDTRTAHELFALMSELARECCTSFLVATHDSRLLEQVDRTHNIEDGRLR